MASSLQQRGVFFPQFFLREWSGMVEVFFKIQSVQIIGTLSSHQNVHGLVREFSQKGPQFSRSETCPQRRNITTGTTPCFWLLQVIMVTWCHIINPQEEFEVGQNWDLNGIWWIFGGQNFWTSLFHKIFSLLKMAFELSDWKTWWMDFPSPVFLAQQWGKLDH